MIVKIFYYKSTYKIRAALLEISMKLNTKGNLTSKIKDLYEIEKKCDQHIIDEAKWIRSSQPKPLSNVCREVSSAL